MTGSVCSLLLDHVTQNDFDGDIALLPSCFFGGEEKKIDFPLIAIMDGEDGGAIRPSSRQGPEVSQKDQSCFLPSFTALGLKQAMFCGLDGCAALSAAAPWLELGNIVWVCHSGKVFPQQEITGPAWPAPLPRMRPLNTRK